MVALSTVQGVRSHTPQWVVVRVACVLLQSGNGRSVDKCTILMRMPTSGLERVVNAAGALQNSLHPVRPNQLCFCVSTVVASQQKFISELPASVKVVWRSRPSQEETGSGRSPILELCKWNAISMAWFKWVLTAHTCIAVWHVRPTLRPVCACAIALGASHDSAADDEASGS